MFRDALDREMRTTTDWRPSVSERTSAIIFVSLNMNECRTMAVVLVVMMRNVLDFVFMLNFFESLCSVHGRRIVLFL